PRCARQRARSTRRVSRMDLAIVLVAAGSSTRMGFPKLWADLGGQPVLIHALHAACAVEAHEVVVVVPPDPLPDVSLPPLPAVRGVVGGARRRDSGAGGLAVSTAPWAAAHDAARALAPAVLYARGLAAAQTTGAAIPVVPLKDTIKRVADSRVLETPPRVE